MNQVWTIAKKELSSFFNSVFAYLLLTVFLILVGIFTWLFGDDVFIRKQADLAVFFFYANIILFVIIPALTMRLLSEEMRGGTMELLITKNVNERQIVLGKFTAAFLMVCITLAFTLVYYVSVSRLGNFDHGASITGYLGLLLMSAAYISIGLFASSLTKNQIVAFILALGIGICFQFLFGFIGSQSSGIIGELFTTLSLQYHYDSIARGVIDSKDVIYFLSITVLGLFLAEYMISKR